jgi:hypothetical protein
LKELKQEISELPPFMRKARMMMIPSAGYFTVISKCESRYMEFINRNLESNIEVLEPLPEDQILEYLLGDLLEDLGWKLCFLSETEIYF